MRIPFSKTNFMIRTKYGTPIRLEQLLWSFNSFKYHIKRIDLKKTWKMRKSNSGLKCQMQVTFDVTESQALALQSLFEQWNSLGGMGSSRWTGFYADGDGNFHPRCKIKYKHGIPRKLNDDIIKAGEIDHKQFGTSKGSFFVDYDGIGWKLGDLDGTN